MRKHRLVGGIVSAGFIIRSAIVSSDATSAADAAGFHTALTLVYLLLAAVYDDELCIEIVCMQVLTLIGFTLEDRRYWHYVYFTGAFLIFVLLEGYTPLSHDVNYMLAGLKRDFPAVRRLATNKFGL